jgi:hypothetical protein
MIGSDQRARRVPPAGGARGEDRFGIYHGRNYVNDRETPNSPAWARFAGEVIEDPSDNDHNEEASCRPRLKGRRAYIYAYTHTYVYIYIYMCVCTRAKEGRRTGNDYARPEKSLMEIVALSTNSPEIPQDAIAFEIPSPPVPGGDGGG